MYTAAGQPSSARAFTTAMFEEPESNQTSRMSSSLRKVELPHLHVWARLSLLVKVHWAQDLLCTRDLSVVHTVHEHRLLQVRMLVHPVQVFV